MNKARGGDGMSVELFQVKRWCENVALNMPANLEDSANGHRTGEGQFSFLSQRWETPKNVQTTTQLHSFHMLARLCPKSFKISFNSMWIEKFQMFKLDLEKAEEPEIKLPTSVDHEDSKRIPEKHLLLLYWLCQNLWLCGSQQTVENSERDGNTRPPHLPYEKSVCKSRSNS